MISINRWVPSDNFQLEPNALAAAKEIERNLALTAGPGAGKTEMLAQRADFLLRTGTCRYPSRILAISFKVDASQNLKARVKKRSGFDLAARFDSHTFHAFAKRIIDHFRLALTGADALDEDYSIGPARIQRQSITFSDMVPLAVMIIENSEIARNAVRQTYSHVFLDEFQDCTKEQYELITACFLKTSSKLVAVGDTKQRIMGWAGALEGIFQTYAADFAAKPLNLYQNFRSAPRLRRMQNAVVRVLDPAAAISDKDLPGEGGQIEILHFDTAVEEGKYLADTICEMIKSGVEPSEIAVLISKQANLYSETLREALIKRGVPFREEDDAQDLASEPIACLITDFLLVANGNAEPEAYRRLLGTVVYAGGVFDDEQEYRARSRWDRFVASTHARITSGQLDLSKPKKLSEIVAELIEVIGRESVVVLSADYAHGTRLDELIDDTVQRISKLLEHGAGLANALKTFSADRAVRIMSIHKSKGLEFDTVIVMAVEKQIFWGDLDAERAAYFVAISRAKQKLLLTVCDYRAVPNGKVRRWDVTRVPQEEFLGYAKAYV